MPVVDLDQIIRMLGQKAFEQQRGDIALDDEGLDAIAVHDNPTRVTSLITWLVRYAVLMGLNSERRSLVAQAALDWCDSQPATASVSCLDDLIAAHSELAHACQSAVDGKRHFTSLASKVLWLRHPHDVPIFDRNAQYALWVLSKCEGDLPVFPPNATSYAQFATIWKFLYERHRDAIEAIDIGNYPYRIRIFDRILWLIGQPVYTLSDRLKV